MSHLLPLLLLLLVPAGGCWREEPQKLCAHRFIRALVQVCGGPRWSPPEGRQDSARDDQEILQWLQNRAFRGLAPDGSMDENLDEGLAVGAGEPESPSGIRRAPRWRRANSSPAQHCCINGCTKQDLLAFCPH
ncbi:insulin-like 3 isoform X1 [Monodelphis domestica]|uniref:Insulin-like 3 n=1 Tax=Monodelphis domestica TaxID=13616 RepID=A0A5F8HAP0_MONDO|nr:insulin-like 3 isoform X1 [Monodelphis domestica]